MAIFVAIARPTPSRNVWSPERTSNDRAVGGLVCVVGATKLVVVCASNKRLVVSLMLGFDAALAVDAAQDGCAILCCNDNHSHAAMVQK